MSSSNDEAVTVGCAVQYYPGNYDETRETRMGIVQRAGEPGRWIVLDVTTEREESVWDGEIIYVHPGRA